MQPANEAQRGCVKGQPIGWRENGPESLRPGLQMARVGLKARRPRILVHSLNPIECPYRASSVLQWCP